MSARSVWIIPNAMPPVRGGTELHAFRVAAEFAAADREVMLIAPDIAGPDDFWHPEREPEMRPPAEAPGFQIHRPLYFTPAERRLARLLPSIHLRLWLARRAQRRFTARLVKMGRARPPRTIIAMPHALPNVEAAARAAESLHASFVYQPCLHEHDPHWNRQAVARLARRARAVLALTHHEAGRLHADYGVASEDIFVCRHGVDLPDQAPPPDTSAAPEILFVGRLSASKGLNVLLSAMPHAWALAPQLRLHLLGASTADLPEIRAQAASLTGNAPQRVRFSPDATEQEKWRALAASAALVLPSRIESFGGVLLEAAAAARPAVTWDIPVFREIIAHEQDGLLVPLGNVAALGAALARLGSDVSLRHRMGLSARAKVEREFRWSHVASIHARAVAHACRIRA